MSALGWVASITGPYEWDRHDALSLNALGGIRSRRRDIDSRRFGPIGGCAPADHDEFSLLRKTRALVEHGGVDREQRSQLVQALRISNQERIGPLDEESPQIDRLTARINARISRTGVCR